MKEYGIGSSTIYDIRKLKDELLKFYSATESTKAITERRVLRKPMLKQPEGVLYEWFMIKRAEGASISRPMLIEKVRELYAKMAQTEECAFSDGWLDGIKSRHGINAKKIGRHVQSWKLQDYLNCLSNISILEA
jgi:hypothetical protein